MVELGIDEITVVLQQSKHMKLLAMDEEWRDVAEEIIASFETHSDFISVFGEPITELRPPQGYTVAKAYGEHNFYLAVAYHDKHSNMGVVIKFSAQSLDYYKEQTGLDVYSFLQKIQDIGYTTRLSRVDIFVDYIDEYINTTDIYQYLMDGTICLVLERTNKTTNEITYRKNGLSFKGIIDGKEVPTIYMGSPKSASRLRIYDKRREQIERRGTKYDRAKNTKNWVRFEGIYRNHYAHQITDELLTVKTDDEYMNFLVNCMMQKYTFMYVTNGVFDGLTEWSDLLSLCMKKKNYILSAPSSKNFELSNSIRYLIGSSGTMTTLYKIKTIWGDEAVSSMLNFMNEAIDEWIPNDDCRYWLRRNKSDYLLNYPEFELFFTKTVAPGL